MRDFLSNRTARVQINAERGDSAPLTQVLPQGVVLSPLLFLLYIDDLRAVVPEPVKVALKQSQQHTCRREGATACALMKICKALQLRLLTYAALTR